MIQDNEDIHSGSILTNVNVIDPSSNTHNQLISNSSAINSSSNDAKGELGQPTVGSSTTNCPDFPLATASDTIGSQNENQVNIPINAEIIKPKTTKRAYKTKDEKEDIIINQKTRILTLENEINQLKNVVNSQNESQHNQNSCCQQNIRDELMDQRIRMLETQMVQNMCINTALTTQLAMQTRSTYPMSAHTPNMHCGAPPFNHFLYPVSTSSHFPPSHIPLHSIPSFQAYNHHQFVHQFQPLAYNYSNEPHRSNVYMAHPSTNHMDTSGLHDRVQHLKQHNYPQYGPPIRQFPVSHSETQTRQPRTHLNNFQQQSHSQSSQKKPSHLPNNSHIMDSHSQHKRTHHQTNQDRHITHQKSEKLCTTKQFPPRDRFGEVRTTNSGIIHDVLSCTPTYTKYRRQNIFTTALRFHRLVHKCKS